MAGFDLVGECFGLVGDCGQVPTHYIMYLQHAITKRAHIHMYIYICIYSLSIRVYAYICTIYIYVHICNHLIHMHICAYAPYMIGMKVYIYSVYVLSTYIFFEGVYIYICVYVYIDRVTFAYAPTNICK